MNLNSTEEKCLDISLRDNERIDRIEIRSEGKEFTSTRSSQRLMKDEETIGDIFSPRLSIEIR